MQRTVLSLFAIVAGSAIGCGPRADLHYDTRVRHPTFRGQHPRVVVDEAHHNAHTLDGRYRPIAHLLRNDGYDVRGNLAPFTAQALEGATVLVIASARGKPNKASPAFTDGECDSVRDWVAAGGALLLITDHAQGMYGRVQTPR